MLADLTILSADPFGIPPRELHMITPVATYVGGSAVWTADEERHP